MSRKALTGQKRRELPAKKGITYGKKRIRVIDYDALLISFAVAAIMATLAVVFNRTGFDKVWYGDVISTAVCIVGFFALMNIGYLFLEGIVIENGTVFLGTDEEKNPIVFKVRDLRDISLCNVEGEILSEEDKRWRSVTVCFELDDGNTKKFFVHLLTKRNYRAILSYFEKGNH